MSALNDLPIELLLEVGLHLDMSSMNALCQVCHPFYRVFNPLLYRHNLVNALWKGIMGKPKTLRKLLEYCHGDRGIGSQYSILNSDGYTPMTAPVCNQNSEVVQIILENGFDSNSTDMHGYTPATCAARTGNEAVMKSLLDYGIDPNQKDSFGRAPISWAAEAGHYGVVKLLIEHEANFELEDDDHETAELSARAKGQDLVPYFLFNYAWRYNGDVPRKPLIWAERNSHGAIVDLLRGKNRVLRLKST